MDGATIITGLTLVAALGAGIVAGVFFAFSTFVMTALGRLPAAQGIAAMQSINVAAVTPPFMVALFGTGLACLPLTVAAIRSWGGPGAGYLLAGSVSYVVGTVLVTVVCNVPRNDALASLDAGHRDSAAPWTTYLRDWTRWNHVRTAAALAAAALLILGFGARASLPA